MKHWIPQMVAGFGIVISIRSSNENIISPGLALIIYMYFPPFVVVKCVKAWYRATYVLYFVVCLKHDIQNKYQPLWYMGHSIKDFWQCKSCKIRLTRPSGQALQLADTHMKAVLVFIASEWMCFYVTLEVQPTYRIKNKRNNIKNT